MKHTFQQQLRRPTGGAVASWSRRRTASTQLLAATTVLTALVGISTAQAADITFNFDSGQPADIQTAGNNATMFPAEGGNPGGFMAITYAENSQTGMVVFGNTDPGKVVTGFSLSADLRVGNPSTERAADGFSISFARDGDPFLTSLADTDLGGNCCAETGTKTGIAVSFDTWSGNVFPTDPNDTTDIEGIIVRVDNVTVNKTGLPTRNGTADDITSLQTGPRDATFWANGGDPRSAESWAGLSWRPFAVDLTPDGKLTVTWKGNKVLDNFQTAFFPSAGQLVFAGRTGNANEHTHVDNLRLITVAQEVTAVPGAPGNLAVSQVGSRRALLTWDAAVVAGDPNARVAYEVLRGDVVVAPLLTTTSFEDRGLAPSTAYTYTVRGKNIAGLAGPDAKVNTTTVADIAGVGFVKNEVWFNIAGTAVDAGTGDPHFSDPPDSIRYGNGFSFGETSNFGNTYGDNFLSKMTGLVTVPVSGSYRFFTRSDDASQLFVKVGSIPDPLAEFPVAVETGCCAAFQEVGEDGTLPEETSDLIALTAGQKVGITLLVKEGGGGDWGQVGWRLEGDTTPAGQLGPIRGAIIESPVDGVGASIAITDDPDSVEATANSAVTFSAAATGSSPYGADYGNAISWQWYINNVAQLGANGSSFTIPVVALAQNNAKIKVIAAVVGANATSAEATLTVNADTVAPTVTDLTGSASFDSVTVTFSEPVADPSATTVGNYQITGLTVSSATRVNDRTILLATSTQAQNTAYPVTINGVRDNANLPSAFTGSLQSFKFQGGVVEFRLWNDETGGFETFADVGVPDSVRLITSAYTGSGLFENYFGQLRLIFTPSVSGNYVFFIASDDHGELYLSTDANPANKKKIAEEPSWSDPRLWNGDGVASNTGTRGEPGARANRSDEYQNTEWATGPGGNIALVAGTQYYLEHLYKEGGGGDHGAIAVKLASEADPGNGANELGGDRVGWFIDPNKIAPIITQRPTSVKYAAGGTITFTVAAESATPMTYQWYQNKKAIAGATSATLTIPNAGVANMGDYYCDVSNTSGTTSTYPDDSSRAIMTGVALVIEAEDYNFDGGQTLPAASVMPLAADLYQGKDGLPGIDFHLSAQSTADAGANGNSLRNGWLNNGVAVDFPVAPEELGNVDVIVDNGGGNTERPDFTLTNNYKIGWGDSGEWYQYTRDFPAGNYNVVFVGSRDGRAANAHDRTLELVTGDRTKVDAATTVIAQLTMSETGGWSSNDHIPFLAADGSGSLASLALGANTTLRLRISRGDGDLDALYFYPAGVSAQPEITGITVGADGKVTITWTGGGQLEAAETLGGPYAPVPGATGGSYVWEPGATTIIYARVRN
ncbi:MAG: immunoglobulin domain-containing protein [Verrucomicrobia bacterium]|nr:immunoglobulin domain-containing protein [Verrucomicrobiota bacterium]